MVTGHFQHVCVSVVVVVLIFPSSFPSITMTAMNDDSVLFLGKENLWRKNELAHQRMRSKPANGPYCTFCHHRRCGDPNTVYGNRSLKKSKVCAWRTIKVSRNRLDMDPSYINARNGEQFCDGRLDILDSLWFHEDTRSLMLRRALRHW